MCVCVREWTREGEKYFYVKNNRKKKNLNKFFFLKKTNPKKQKLENKYGGSLVFWFVDISSCIVDPHPNNGKLSLQIFVTITNNTTTNIIITSVQPCCYWLSTLRCPVVCCDGMSSRVLPSLVDAGTCWCWAGGQTALILLNLLSRAANHSPPTGPDTRTLLHTQIHSRPFLSHSLYLFYFPSLFLFLSILLKKKSFQIRNKTITPLYF